MTTVMRPVRRSAASITPILEHLLEFKPASVLDVGAGYGTWGFLLRSELDEFYGTVRIDGVEPNPAPVNLSPAVHAYNTLLTVDLFDPLAAGLQESYELVLLDGYLDRLSKPAGLKVLDRVLELAPRVVLTFPERSRWNGILADYIADHHPNLRWTDFSGRGEIRGELWRLTCDA